jgi:hypothetical protein
MHSKNDSGFSYLDVLIATTILLVGVLALAGAMTSAVVLTTDSEQQLVAKQQASSALEAIFSARDIDALGFDAVGNVGDPAVPGGVFLTGRQRIWPSAGADGIIGTTDDALGRDGTPSSGDEGVPDPTFERQIVITDIPNPDRPTAPISLRQITVTIFYSVGSNQRQETYVSYIADFNT